MSSELMQAEVLPPVTEDTLKRLEAIEAELAKRPQVKIETTHHLHAGVYSRTIFLPKGIMATGVIIKRPTQLIVSGHAVLTSGDKAVELKGYHVLEGLGGRKQIALAKEDTWFTMLFATKAKTVEEAEEEFTDEADRLQTRKEQKCLV